MADRSEPMEGRCNAQTGGGYCRAHPVSGGKRCRIHGGDRTLFAQRLRKLDVAAQEEIQAAIDDPDLMDVRRPLAVAETVIARTPLLPSEEAIRRRAQRLVIGQVGSDLLTLLRQAVDESGGDRDALREALDLLLCPTDADLEEATMALHEQSMRLLATWSKRQVEAARTLEWAKAIREQILPFFGELSLRLATILRQHVPEDRYQVALDAMRAAIVQSAGEISVAAEKVK